MANLGRGPRKGSDDDTRSGPGKDICNWDRSRIHRTPIVWPYQSHSGNAMKGLDVQRSRPAGIGTAVLHAAVQVGQTSNGRLDVVCQRASSLCSRACVWGEGSPDVLGLPEVVKPQSLSKEVIAAE